MEPTILHLAIDSFAIQAERLRCPKLVGRPVALARADSARPRVMAASREARAAGVLPGTPLPVARRLCRDLIALPPDGDLYAGLSESIQGQLAALAPLAGATEGARPGAPSAAAGRFALDLTGLARNHGAACERASRAGREVERVFGLHPTLGVASTRLVSAIAAHVLAPDGELLDVPTGSEPAFLAPLSVRLLPSARGAVETRRLDLLSVRRVRDVQALEPRQLAAAVGRAAAAALWRESRGLDPVARRPEEAPPTAVAEETLASETNDGRVLRARAARLALELGFGLRRRGAAARRLALVVTYADGRAARAREALPGPTSSAGALGDAAARLLERALARRVRVRRIRLEAWEAVRGASQLELWPGEGAAAGAPGAERATEARAAGLDAALDRIRLRFGTEIIVPGSWMAARVVLHPSARP